MKAWKKAVAVVLSGMCIVGMAGALSGPERDSGQKECLAAQKQTAENLYGAGENGINIGMEAGLSADLGDTVFDGTKILEISDAGDMGLFRENIKNVNSLKVSISFCLAEDFEGEYFNLLELCNSKKSSAADSPAEEVVLIVSKTGCVYLMSGAQAGKTDWKIESGTAVTDGAFHTLELSVSGKGLSIQMDGKEEKTVGSDGSTKGFFTAFFGGEAEGYTDWRGSLDMIRIGGLKAEAFQAHANFKNFKGQISVLKAAGANDLSDLTGSGISAGMFEPTDLENTWLFGGGVETQGRFSEIRGVRSYVGQFEEYVRWVKIIDTTLYGMQRYTINAGKQGQDAVSFAAGLDDYIERLQPKAVAYLTGPEDYGKGAKGIADFQEAIAKIIEKSLAMKDDKGYVVIQLPHAVNDSQVNADIALYANAAAETVKDALAENKDRIALVDHFSQTNNSTFKNAMLTEDGLLNAQGHHEIARQFSKAVKGSTDGFPAIEGDWEEVQMPEHYLTLVPEAVSAANSLKVTVPSEIEAKAWNYIVQADGMEITGTAFGNPFTIENLPAGKGYKLTVRTEDQNTQLSAVEGVVRVGDTAKEENVSGSIRQEIRKKVENKDKPLTWLFMGDSITHAAAHTKGYDGIAQLFEKYLKEDLGRIDDTVINTAVSGAQTVRTMENLEQRMTKYHADIVSVMLGTNDTRDPNVYSQYKSNLKKIADAIREANPDAIVIFRSPTPGNGAWKDGPSGEDGSVARMAQAAEEDGNILFIDQYTTLREAVDAYPYLFQPPYYFGDGLVHPGAAGHVLMTTQFIRECGLDTNTKIANLSYKFNYEEEKSEIVPQLQISDMQDTVTVCKSDLEAAYGSGEIGELTLSFIDADGRTYRKTAGLKEAEAVVNLPSNCRYIVEVSANIKGSAAKHVSFAKQEIRLSLEEADAEDEAAANAVAEKIEEAASAADFLENRQEIEALKQAYNSLTEVQKQLIPVDILKTYKQIIRAADEKFSDEDKNHPDDGGDKKEGFLPQPVQAAKEGETYSVGSYFYKVTSVQKQTVEITGCRTKRKSINIPDTIKLLDKEYKVAAVGAFAFKNNEKATSVSIGKNVEEIGKNAFAGCKSLKKATIKSAKLMKICSKSFYNCKKLKTVILKTKVLKSVAAGAFKGIHKNAKIKVPSVKLKVYKKLLAKKGQGKKVKIVK